MLDPVVKPQEIRVKKIAKITLHSPFFLIYIRSIRQIACNKLTLYRVQNSRCINRFLHVRSHKHGRSFQMGQH